MYKIGLNEVEFLKRLAGSDVENKKHCVQLLSSFECRNHLCLVFELLHMNLRKVLNKYGHNIGLNLMAIQVYAKQMFVALKHLQNCGILHCDIKLDNILMNDSTNARKSKLKICDFGSAMFAGENEITPYLVSRFYRAPEIIFGLPLSYNHAIDIWSMACCLYELHTGKILFHGNSNNHMLQLHMEMMGAFPKKMLKKAQFKDHHFDKDLNFCNVEEDLVSKR
jgi:serine/threonine-protein kinase PRP4